MTKRCACFSIVVSNTDCLTVRQFVKRGTLTGHEDWVRSLSLNSQPMGRSESGTLMLASGSQDGSVRVWTVEKMADDEISGMPSLDDMLSIADSDIKMSSKKVAFKSPVHG
jgi:WD40 repeat protein